MNIIYFGYDFMIHALEKLLAQGHSLAGVFTFPCDNVFNYNVRILALAAEHNVRVIADKPLPSDIVRFGSSGQSVFLSAGYPYKIPPIDRSNAYGINFHPSFLPAGRGLMPTPHIIINHPEAAGFTIHKLAPRFDAGDILYQEKIDLDARETAESLSAKIALRGAGVIEKVIGELPHYWDKAHPQDETWASWFPPPDEALRTLDFSQNVDKIDAVARAFGRYGSLARYDGVLWVVYAHDVWQEKHGHVPGAVVHRLAREIVIAAQDGFVLVKHAEKLLN